MDFYYTENYVYKGQLYMVAAGHGPPSSSPPISTPSYVARLEGEGKEKTTPSTEGAVEDDADDRGRRGRQRRRERGEHRRARWARGRREQRRRRVQQEQEH